MHKSRTRRQQIAIRSFTYGVMTLLAVFGVLLCLAWAMGFRFDFNGGKLTQVALLQFNSFPSDATVRVNNEVLPSKTPTRFNVRTGESTVTISKKGYRSWQKTISLNSSQVLWLDYIRLVPSSITTDSIKDFPAVEEICESPDKHWILLRTGKTVSSFVLADISDPKNVRFSNITIDPDKITTPVNGQDEAFSIVEWDSGSRYVLIRHLVGNQAEYLQIDRQSPGSVQNFTKDFGMNIEDPHFSGTSGQVFFGLTGTDLRKFDYSNKTASAPLVGGVESYRLQDVNNQLTFVSKETKNGKETQSVGIYDNGRIENFKTYDKVSDTIAVLTRYRDTDYLAVARGETVTIYPNPLDKNNKVGSIYLNSSGGIEWLDISPKGRFVVAGHGDKIVNFDLDTNENYSFEIENTNGPLEWIDNSHIVDRSNKHINIVEFDGSNKESIVSANSRAVLSYDNKYLFSFGNSAGGVSFQRSKLHVD